MGKGGDSAEADCGGCCCLIFTVVHMIGKVVVGSMNVHECEIEPLIPIWLIVSGLTPFFVVFLMFCPLYLFCFEDVKLRIRIGKAICGIAFIFYVAWLVCGSVLIFPTYYKVSSDSDCYVGLIKFAYGMAIWDWITLLPMTCGMGVFCLTL